ncbi:hypothetical protein AB0M35_25545 [Micromonospora sp. NPDC051196]|uniref:hypothetical protein n=1 Tax=Micromonospora sp. NPDC051196 TaxID=3155281 RepID=UPI00342B072D
MSVSLDTPSIAAADMMGLFRAYDAQHGHPTDGESWARAVVSKIQDDLERSGAYSWYDVGNKDFTPAELAVWHWYLDQTKSDRWKTLVFEYRQRNAQDQVTTPTESDPGFSRLDEPKVSTDIPDVKPFGGVEGNRGGIAVNTEAIAYFCNSLKLIVPPGRDGMLATIRQNVGNIRPLPGKFARAELLRLDVVGSGTSPGLRGQTVDVLGDIETALRAIQEDLQELIKRYDDAEELNSLSVNEFNGAMRGSTGRINNLS